MLDARPQDAIDTAPLANAVAADWRRFSHRDATMRGCLVESDAELTARLQAIGVARATPIVVVADPPRGWGEDGRIAWMLRALGHGGAAFVDGGIAALCADGPIAIAPPPARGDFVVARDARYTIDRTALRARLADADLALLDSRTADEYAGAAMHGEARGGRLPGARHLPYRSLMKADGRLLPATEIRERLVALGMRKEMELVAYCTGGVRSAWLTAVLVQLGYRARNFPGSIWEWAAAPAATHPLLRDA